MHVETETKYANEKIENLERLQGQVNDGFPDAEAMLDALNDAGILEQCGLTQYDDQATWDVVDSAGIEEEEERWDFRNETFTEYKPNEFYRDSEVFSLDSPAMARATHETHFTSGVQDVNDFHDVLEGVRRHDAAEDRQAGLSEVAEQTRPQDSDLASPEEVQARRTRGMRM